MKKFLQVSLVCFLGIFMSLESFAQWKIGVGGSMAHPFSDLGSDGLNEIHGCVQIRGSYKINHVLDLIPEFSYTFDGITDGDIKGWIGSTDLHYNFSPNRSSLYFLGGINYTNVKLEACQEYYDAYYDYYFEDYYSKKRHKIGVNVGLGFKTESRVGFYSELKYNTAMKSAVVSAGFLFHL